MDHQIKIEIDRLQKLFDRIKNENEINYLEQEDYDFNELTKGKKQFFEKKIIVRS